MKKLLPLFFLIAMGLGLGVVSAHDFAHETVFLSDIGGGNITFAYDFTADTYTVASNQARFTVFNMDLNGTWSSLGFRNPWANATMNITHVGTDYVAFDVTVASPTVFEVWLPTAGEPDNINGANNDTWASPTLELTMNGNGTITLEWITATPDIYIYVVNGLGHALENVAIAIWGPTGTLDSSGYTNASGLYYYQPPNIGNYTIQTGKENYQTRLNIYTIVASTVLNITLQSIEDGIMFNMELLIFCAAGFILTAYGYKSFDVEKRMLGFGFGGISWLASMYMWVLNHSGGDWGLVIALLAPFLACFAWFMQSLGAYVDGMGQKHRIGEDYYE